MQVQLLEVVTIELLRIAYTKVPVSSCMYMDLAEKGDVLAALFLSRGLGKSSVGCAGDFPHAGTAYPARTGVRVCYFHE